MKGRTRRARKERRTAERARGRGDGEARRDGGLRSDGASASEESNGRIAAGRRARRGAVSGASRNRDARRLGRRRRTFESFIPTRGLSESALTARGPRRTRETPPSASPLIVALLLGRRGRSAAGGANDAARGEARRRGETSASGRPVEAWRATRGDGPGAACVWRAGGREEARYFNPPSGTARRTACKFRRRPRWHDEELRLHTRVSSPAVLLAEHASEKKRNESFASSFGCARLPLRMMDNTLTPHSLLSLSPPTTPLFDQSFSLALSSALMIFIFFAVLAWDLTPMMPPPHLRCDSANRSL